MAYNSRTRQLWFKKQSDRAVFEKPTSADQKVIVYDRSDRKDDWGHTGGANRADGTMTKGRSYSGKKSRGYDFMTEMQYSGTLNVAPKNWVMLEASGFHVDTSGANAKATWSGVPNCAVLSIGAPEYSCGSTPTGVVDYCASAAGTLEFGADSVGAPIMYKHAFTGKMAGHEDKSAAALVGPSGNDTSVCEKFLGALSTFTMGGYVYRVYSWNATIGQDIQSEDNAADVTNSIETGINLFAIKDANPQLTLTVERVAKATNDTQAEVAGDTVNATAVMATTHFDITFGISQVIDVQAGNSNNTATETLTVKFDTVEIKQAR